MGEAGAEPSMEDILSSIKRIIAEEDEPASRPRRSRIRAVADDDEHHDGDGILELSDPIAAPAVPVSADGPVALSARSSGVSQESADAARGALDALSRLLVRPETGSDGTLEGLVRDMLRPMLSEWLDAKLPGIVEAMVAREIERITGSAR